MRLVTREEIIRKLIENLDKFDGIVKENYRVITRIKHGPSQLASFGLLPYITFLVSKYKINDKDSEGYTMFLNFLIYLTNSLGLLKIENLEEIPKKGDENIIKSFLNKIKDLKDPEYRIFEKNLMLILEEMKKIYAGLYKESRQKR